MSCEDSLSQSILQPSEVHEHLSPQSTNALFDEVEFIQKEIINQMKRASAEPCKVKLAKVKEILQHVNKELITEKQILSSWKVSLSQSQLENNFPQGGIKERANTLILHQKRLLSAFQRQKLISDALRDKKYEESQANSTLSAAKSMPSQDVSPFTIPETRVYEESSQVSQESDHLPTKSAINQTLIHTSPNWTKRGATGQKDFVHNSSSKQNGMDIVIHNSIVQTTSKTDNGHFIAGKDNQKPALGTMALTSKNPIKVIQKNQAKPLATDGNKKSTKARKRCGQKLPQCPDNTIAQSNKLNKNQFWKRTSESMTADHNAECSLLPFLEEPEPTKTYDTGSLDVSKLKFIVMPKDEEFLDSSTILPMDFWDSDINQTVAIDSSFLKVMDFQ